MSVYIPGMEMPTSCLNCRFHKSIYCTLTDICTNTAQGCPLVSVPPHGRLIDADALTKEINDRIEAAIKWGVNAIADRDDEIKTRAEQAVATFCEASLAAKKLPAIIPAEEGEG